MIRINNRWYYEPLKGDIGWMELVRASYRAGDRFDLKGLTREQRIDFAVYYFGKHPVPVPDHILITVR